jgi:predicted dehydrogenase
MRFLQVGLGSMGKRRLRCLRSLEEKDVIGFDPRADRRKESEEKYNIKTVDDLGKVDFKTIDAIIISTPPDIHERYIKLALEKKKPAFIEASVVLGELVELNKEAKNKGVFLAPSATMCFHPAIKDIKEIIDSGKYGKVTNFTYYSGQYLPDWHPWEGVKDYYVSKKETGGGREIVPFELTWIVKVLGFPKKVKGIFGKTIELGVDIDDTYAIALDFGNCIGSLMVDVVARYGTRSLVLNMEKGQIVWRWDEGEVKLFDSASNKWISYKSPQGSAAEGYNKNIVEDMYIDELKNFIEAIPNPAKYISTLEDDIKVLKILLEAEKK